MRQNKNQFQEGIILLLIAMSILPGIDTIAKFLSDTIAPGQSAWSRFFFQTLILFPFVLVSKSYRVGPQIWIHAARGFLIAIATLMFFTALAKMPVADAISIFFVEPLILTLLSFLILKEPIGWRRVSAVIFGFCGALIIIQPSFQAFGFVVFLPVLVAFAFALYIILTRWLVDESSAITMQFYAGIFGLLTMSIAMFAGYKAEISYLTPVWPSGSEWLLLFLLGAIATTGHMLIVLAVRRVGASMTAPFQYFEIISATILGYIFFNDFPTRSTWLGVTIIIASGVYVFVRERRLAEQTSA